MVKKLSNKKSKPLIIFMIIIAATLVVVAIVKILGFGFAIDDDTVKINAAGEYIGVVKIEGSISSESQGLGSSGYSHSYTLDAIKALKKDENNKGVILYINSPGGGVYESDEVYLAIKDYKKATGRPVYTYMGSMAASGGYYIAAASDKIFANRNTWTGSIGVRLSTMYDVSEFLDKQGIKTKNITSGKNKAMGDISEKLTKEQEEIYQSIIDESYEQFLDIVAKGRNMKKAKVKKLADGRIYTAKQALRNGLIDKISTYEDAIIAMKKMEKLNQCEVVELDPPEESFYDSIFGAVKSLSKSGEISEIEEMLKLNNNGKFSIEYMSDICK